ncbi:hypothetical protein ALI144C_20475 [Actinosynnema sp. ALI-1.44]|uniref:TetR/AcrR family transcriptional regulator C-terminal domain-containing protein n=1 Tax=Actinosynnema sp. ALI-1.44 TaxID=1933779 RepID=UPI00097C9200|nr:TetR/AcrR family transcriptional regulator C-terminal domain-containing protein [Actinosynnema sp. ALI-1.44]ONI81666.1 hypothetical protein ALI144C_20475 [Actinosynnema sp. ALI-1.44]
MTRRDPLNREKVLDAALELAAAEGLSGLSMRKLAKALGVEAMALYNHVANKNDILKGLAERVLASVAEPDPALPWAERVRATAISLHRALNRHPVVPFVLTTDKVNPTALRALRPLDSIVGALYEAGFDDHGVRQAWGALNSLVFGSLLLTTAGFTGRPAEEDQTDVYVRQVDPAKLPHFHRVLPALSAGDRDVDFRVALDMLISGLVAAAPVGSEGMTT